MNLRVKPYLDNGADLVLIDNGEINTKLYQEYPNGVNKVLELVGTKTLKDSLKCLGPKSVSCMTGILGNEWTISDFTPMGDIS
jgi:NADPH2:quinone reductase